MAETMKLSCLQENLHRGLSIVGRAVATKSALPITSNVLMATDQGMLKLTGTNLEIAITTWIGAMIETEGQTTLPHKMFTDLVNAMPADRVDLTLGEPEEDAPDEATTMMRINHGRSITRMNSMDAKNYPDVPQVDPDNIIEIPVETLRTGIRLTAFSAATDESRPVLTGIMILLDGEKLTMASADGFRLSVYSAELPLELPEPIKVVIPARSLQELDRILSQQATPVKIHIPDDHNKVMFKLENVEMVTQLIRGEFPDYSQLIPESPDTVAVVDIDQLKRAVQSAGVFARDGSNIVRLQFAPLSDQPDSEKRAGRLTISASSAEVGSSTDELDIDNIDGDAAKIAFNVRYLTDVINIMDKGKISIALNSPSNPGVIRMAENQQWTHVTMPMYVDW